MTWCDGSEATDKPADRLYWVKFFLITKHTRLNNNRHDDAISCLWIRVLSFVEPRGGYKRISGKILFPDRKRTARRDTKMAIRVNDDTDAVGQRQIAKTAPRVYTLTTTIRWTTERFPIGRVLSKNAREQYYAPRARNTNASTTIHRSCRHLEGQRKHS